MSRTESDVRPSIDAIASGIEERVSRLPTVGALTREAVEAMDIVFHALIYTNEPNALALWREALLRRTLNPRARGAVHSMLAHVEAAHYRGEAVSDICDCVIALFDPAMEVKGVESAGLDALE